MDKINPDYYKNETSLECIEAMEIVFGQDTSVFCLCNAWKYIWRWRNKNGDEDLTKALWYLDCIKEDNIRPDYYDIAMRIRKYIMQNLKGD